MNAGTGITWVSAYPPPLIRAVPQILEKGKSIVNPAPRGEDKMAQIAFAGELAYNPAMSAPGAFGRST